MNLLYEKLLMIKYNTLIYLGKPSLKLLRTYINGYIARQCEIDANYDFSFYKEFQEYIGKTYNIALVFNWENIIEEYSSSEESAFDEFYKLLDLFLKEKRQEELIGFNITTLTYFRQELYKERHFTNHGNPKRFTNPHDHYFNWLSNDVYYLENAINYYYTIPKFTIE